MPKSCFQSAQILGISVMIPNIKRKTTDMADLFDGNLKQLEKIKESIGLNEIYIADEKTTGADLCESAAKDVLTKTNISKDEIDAIICVTQTPDFIMPANATYLHGKLGLDTNCAAFDINLGCSGYIYGLWLSYMMIEAGNCRNVLLLAGDTISKMLNKMDKSTAILFGDAGTATIIQRDDKEYSKSYFSLHTNGNGYTSLIIPAGGARLPRTCETNIDFLDEDGNVRNLENLYMNGAEIFNFSIKEEPVEINELLKFSGLPKNEIDYIVFHQANKYIIKNIVRRIGIPLEKVPCDTVSKYGNQSSASIPVTICDVLADAIGSNIKINVIMSGFGVGLSWGSCLVELHNVKCNMIFG